MRRHRGQSVVEMALVLPVLLLLLFGIIDFGYYLYAYSTLYQAARDGAAKASLIPPWPNKVQPFQQTDRNDECVANVMFATQADATLFPDLTTTTSAPGPYVQVIYPKAETDNPRKAPEEYRKVGEPIEVRIAYRVEPLTPLFRMINIGNRGQVAINVTARRSIETLGNNPNAGNLQACKKS
jgi:TadE-like protein